MTREELESRLEALGVPANLSKERREGIMMLIKYCDKGSVVKTTEKRGKRNYHKWTGELDDGVFKGVFVVTFDQEAISPIRVITQLASTTGWPGHKRMVSNLNSFASKTYL